MIRSYTIVLIAVLLLAGPLQAIAQPPIFDGRYDPRVAPFGARRVRPGRTIYTPVRGGVTPWDLYQDGAYRARYWWVYPQCPQPSWPQLL